MKLFNLLKRLDDWESEFMTRLIPAWLQYTFAIIVLLIGFAWTIWFADCHHVPAGLLILWDGIIAALAIIYLARKWSKK